MDPTRSRLTALIASMLAGWLAGRAGKIGIVAAESNSYYAYTAHARVAVAQS